MIDCSACAQALPIPLCATEIQIGAVAYGLTNIAVRFTDVATGRVTMAEIDPDVLPNIVAITPFEFAPGLMVMAEVVTDGAYGPGAPVEFLPWTQAPNGSIDADAYPVVCMMFTPTKMFDTAGSLLAEGPRILIVQQ